MHKKLFSICIELFCFLCVFAQSPSLRLGVLKGISCAPSAYLIENKEKLSVQNMAFQIFNSEREELPKLLRGELDVAFLYAKDAAKVFDKSKKGIVFLGVAQNEALYLLTNDETYGSLEDIKGKSIIAPEENSQETRIFKHILNKKNISVGNDDSSVKLDFSLPQAQFANSLISLSQSYALVREPFASVAIFNSSKNLRAENIQKIYAENEEGSNIPLMLLVARADFVKNNRDIIRRFIDVYKNAMQWTNKNPSKAALLIEKHKLGLSAPIAKNAIPYSSLVFREATVAKSDLEKLYTILGSELPSEEFYFSK